MKVALAAYLADRGIRIVHVWRNGPSFSAMLEPQAKGSGATETEAVMKAAEIGLAGRAWMLGYVL